LVVNEAVGEEKEEAEEEEEDLLGSSMSIGSLARADMILRGVIFFALNSIVGIGKFK
jgi:hypothetical protein